MDEEELFDHLTLELSELLDFIRINKQKKGDVTVTKIVSFINRPSEISFVVKI